MPDRDTLYRVFLKLGGAFIAFVASVVASRYLGPAGRGKLAIILSLGTLLLPLLTLNLASGIPYWMSRKPELGPSYICNCFYALVLLGVPLLGCLALGLGLVAPDYSPVLIFISVLWTLCLAIQNIFLGICLGLQQARFIYRLESLSCLFLLFGSLVLIATGLFSLLSHLGHRLLLLLVIDIGLMVYSSAYLRGRFRASWHLFRESLPYAIRSYVGALTTTLMWNVDHLYVNYYQGDTAVGYYSVALALVTYATLIPRAVFSDAYPELVQLSSWKARVARCWSLARKVALLVTALLLVISLVGPRLILLLYGQQFAGSLSCLQWLLPGILCLTVQETLAMAADSKGIPTSFLLLSLCSAVLNLLLNGMWIPTYGIVGAAWATSATYGLYLMATVGYLWWQSQRE